MPPLLPDDDIEMLDMTGDDIDLTTAAMASGSSTRNTSRYFEAPKENRFGAATARSDERSSTPRSMEPEGDEPGRPNTGMAARRRIRSAPSSFKRTTAPLDLASMSTNEVEALYRAHFKAEIPIEEIDVPTLAKAFPDFRKEIGDSYMKYTTFFFKVILDYDVGCGLFYMDQGRYQDCGKLVIYPKALARLRKIGADNIVYKNVRLDICTHFRTLAQITLEVRQTKLNVGCAIDGFANKLYRGTDGHAVLEEFIDGRVEMIEDAENDFTNGKDGFSFQDLEEIAKLFAPKWSEGDKWGSQYRDYNGPWIGEHNDYDIAVRGVGKQS